MYVEFVSVSVRVCLFDLLFLTVRSAQIRNFSNHLPAAALPPPLLSSITCNSCHNLLLLLLLLLLILWLFISDGRVCVRAYVRYDTGAPSVFFFSFPLLLHSLSLSRARSNNQVFTQLCNDGVRDSTEFTPASKCACECLFACGHRC